MLLDLYEQRKAWAAEHGHDLEQTVNYLIEKQNPRLPKNEAPEDGTR